ncbi:unnamed protein product [Caretta caretta]
MAWLSSGPTFRLYDEGQRGNAEEDALDSCFSPSKKYRISEHWWENPGYLRDQTACGSIAHRLDSLDDVVVKA